MYPNSPSALILLLYIVVMSSCKAKPVDAVYYGDWVNTYTEEYNYETTNSSKITEASWPVQRAMMPPIVHLLNHRDYIQFFRTRSGKLAGQHIGKWSIRNNNDITIQTDEHLFYGKIVLLNEVLTIEGQKYPLDKNRQAIRAKAIEQKLKYRRANNKDLEILEETMQLYEQIQREKRK